MDTGFPSQDAQTDFSRARRRQQLARLGMRLRRHDDVDVILPFEEVTEALGLRGERSLGLKTIPLDSIVGTVDRSREFDRSFRPTSGRVRPRWQRIAEAQRRGEAMPPISVYRIGDMHFVKDGHHRVSVARATGLKEIDAYVTEVLTEVDPSEGLLRLADLPLKSHQRVFYERVPLPPHARKRIQLSDPWDYATLAEGVEAWGFRAIQSRGESMSRAEVAEAWFREDYESIVAAIRDVGLLLDCTETEAYMRIVSERYRLMRTHGWDEDVLERLQRELR
ncbi:MAG: chromosome partitioning protein ParB [Actinobacteria bacterium 13_1_20CM_3_68_9]|nr:MAG: chromosome partitioning protein ParB [Actinobacteria bacterium 13_1_20CM_3_68_9]